MSKPRRDWPGLTGAAVLAGTALAAYGRTFSVPFLFDDTDSIPNNLSIRHWSTAFWPPFNTTVSGRPLLNLSLALNYAISGTGVWSYHAVNLLIHVLGGLTLFGIVRRTLKNSGKVPQSGTLRMEKHGPALRDHATRGHATSIAFAVALLWTLHPLQIESVTYIVQRAESLMGLFYLLTIYCFIRYAEETEGGSRKAEVGSVGKGTALGPRLPMPAFRLPPSYFRLFSVLACLFGMATKEVMVSAPVIVLLYDRTFLAGSFREAWKRRRGIYLALAATWIPLAWFVIGTGGNRAGTSGFGSGVSWWTYALTQFPAIVRYLKLSVWPHPLVLDYGTEWVRGPAEVVPPAVIVLALIAVTGWALIRKSEGGSRKAEGRIQTPGGFHTSAFRLPTSAFLSIFFFAILAPTSLIPGNRQTAAEHRMYLALIPVIVLVVVGIYRWLGRAALPVCLILAAGLFAITVGRNETYRSALIIWTDTVAQRPANPWAHNNLGFEVEKIPGRLNDSIAQFEEALRLNPTIVEAYNNLGAALEKAPGRSSEAIAAFEEALRRKPDFAEAHNNLGVALEKMPGRLNDAIAHYNEALRLNPDYAEVYYNLGNVMSAQGRTKEAIARYNEALRLTPDDPEVHNNLGNTLNAAGRPSEAIAQYGEALRLNPGFVDAHNNLGTVLEKMPGRLNDAITQYEEAIRLNPDYVEAHNNLGNALNAEGRTPEAVAQYEEALRLNPDVVEARNNLGTALGKMPGRLNDAIAQYEAALRLKPDYAAIHFNLAVALLDAPGRLNDAIAQFEETLRLQPDYAEAHNNLGTALGKMPGRLNDAIAQYDAALRLKPDFAEAHNNLGYALERMPGRLNDAIAQYQEAVRLEPGFAPFHFNLALALLKVPGRAEEAAAQLEATLRLQPDNDPARQTLAAIRQRH